MSKAEDSIRLIVPGKQNLRSERLGCQLSFMFAYTLDIYSVYDASLYVIESRNDVLEEKVIYVIGRAERKGITFNRQLV